jgi:CBS domain-containing protein
VLRDAARQGKILTAADLMTRKLITATEEMPVHEVADLMVRHRINHVPVTRDDRLMGIVARGDLVRELVGGTSTQASE